MIEETQNSFEARLDSLSRVVDLEQHKEDRQLEGSLRPKTFDLYVGQTALKENLKIFIQAAKSRGESLDHMLFYGPPGLGKTTLAGIIASEMGANIRITTGPAIERPGDMAAILNSLNEGDVLFIDEIHRLNRQVEEILYSAMEDFAVDIMLGKGPQAKSIRLQLPHFTLIGATTRAGLLSAPLRDRFGMLCHMEFYSSEELTAIVNNSAKVLNVPIDREGAGEIASRSRGTPRLANRLLKRVRDFAQIMYEGKITKESAICALNALKVDPNGLDDVDRKLLTAMADLYNGGPVGIETLSASVGEDAGTLEDVCEPYLMQQGYLMRTPRGRVLTDKAYLYLGKTALSQSEEDGLFGLEEDHEVSHE